MPIQAILPLLLIVLAFVGFCLYDLRGASVRHLPKWVWAAAIVLSVPLGGIVYLAVGREQR